MNFKASIIVLLVFVAAGAYLILSMRGSAPDTERPVLDVAPDRVRQVGVIGADGSRLLLEQRGGQWRILQPLQAAASPDAATGLVQAIVGLKGQGNISRETAEQARTVGSDPAYRVELTLIDGRQHTLTVGHKTVAGDMSFVQVDGKGRVFMVPAAIHDALGRPAAEYRLLRDHERLAAESTTRESQ